ncbi:LysR family transcriptional regulator [Paracoccus aminophilus]|uniref:Transcriptional regulator, LysR family n=1 Tax=Paracoccus aminophilus JCM 7686 TaxID=1367847 RepID=S5Y006_PARAH|nr:LysR family transcriptional regulator [Paracoccus aminophilus]AGT09020.1 transcriptional regulator, LysR family [Paracoccus aminophilus JCM 7686]
MSIRAFRTLLAIARYGSFARAGEVVGLTQSAVSLQIRTLEREFGAQLFDRSRRLPVLTEAGRIVLQKAGEILEIYDGIGAALGDETSLAGRLRLGAIESVLGGILPDALAELHARHPRLRVHVSGGMSSDMAVKVVQGELDAAVTTEPVRPYPADLAWTPLYEDQFWIVAPRASAAGPALDTPRDLLTRYPFIRLDGSAWAGRMITQELRRQNLELRDEMVFDSPEVILRMVASGLGVAVVALTEQHRKSLDLTLMPFGTPQLRRRIVLLHHATRGPGAPGEALAEVIVALSAHA